MVHVTLRADPSAADTKDNQRNSPLAEYLGDRKKTGQTIFAEDSSRAGQITFQGGAELYFEEGELASPAIFDQADEESQAGFRQK
jgi:hypothetical protein